MVESKNEGDIGSPEIDGDKEKYLLTIHIFVSISLRIILLDECLWSSRVYLGFFNLGIQICVYMSYIVKEQVNYRVLFYTKFQKYVQIFKFVN